MAKIDEFSSDTKETLTVSNNKNHKQTFYSFTLLAFYYKYEI